MELHLLSLEPSSVFGLWSADFSCAELVNRVSPSEYLGHDPISCSFANTGIRKVLIVGKELFSLSLLIKTRSPPSRVERVWIKFRNESGFYAKLLLKLFDSGTGVRMDVSSHHTASFDNFKQSD